MSLPFRKTRRLVAVAAAAAAVSFGATGCDSSPVAASVNGTLIKQAALRAEMRGLASSPEFVQGWDRSYTVPVNGSAPGTFSTAFATSTLYRLIVAEALHQAVGSTGHTVSPDILATARAIDEQGEAGWFQFSPALRDKLVSQQADLVALEPLPADVSLAQQYLQLPATRAFFFRQVCVRTITVSVPNGSGSVDYGASLDRANQIKAEDFSGNSSSSSSTSTSSTTATTVPGATTLPGGSSATTTPGSSHSQSSTTVSPGAQTGSVPDSTTSSSTSSTSSTGSTSVPPAQSLGGSVLCYSPSQLEQQGEQFFSTVLGLAPGQATDPIRTGYGYNLIAVDSRQELSFSPEVGAALTYLISNLEPQGTDQPLVHVLLSARVTVNPQFGVWDPTNRQGPLSLPSLPTDVDPNLGFSLTPTSS